MNIPKRNDRDEARRLVAHARVWLHDPDMDEPEVVLRALRTLARQIVGDDNFFQVYVKASMETCRARDVKGLYAKADGGQLKQFTGRDSIFEEPESADLILDTEVMDELTCLETLLLAIRDKIVRVS